MAGELWRNLCARPPRALVSAGLSTVLLVLVGVGSSAAYHAAADAHSSLGREGARILSVEAATGMLSGERCEQLSGFGFVVAAGGFRDLGYRRVGQAGSLEVRVLEVTPTMLTVLGLPASTTAAVGSSIAALTGTGPGELFEIDGWPPLGALVLPPTGHRSSAFERTVLVPSLPFGRVDSCLVETDSYLRLDEYAAIVEGAFADSASPVRAAPFLRLGRFTEQPVERLRSSAASRAWLIAAAVLAAVESLVMVSRRHEMALMRALGMRRVTVAAMVWLERALLAAVSAVLGFCSVVVAAAVRQEGIYLGELTYGGMSIVAALAALLPALVGVVVLHQGADEMSALKDR